MKKFKPGDLVICRTLPNMHRTFDGKIGTIREGGHDDLCPGFNTEPPSVRNAAFVEWARPVRREHHGGMVSACWMDSNLLTKISGPGAVDIFNSDAFDNSELTERIASL